MKRGEKTKPTEKLRGPVGRGNQLAAEEDFLTDFTRQAPLVSPVAESGSLGDRIRSTRELRGLTLGDVSSRTGIDAATLKRIESNEMVPPLGQLVTLAKALEVRMGSFVASGVDKPMAVVRVGQRRPIARHGEKRAERYGYYYESLAPEKANRAMEPFIVTLTSTDTEEFSSHDGQEFLFVLEGEIRVQVDKQIEFLQPGDATYYDSNQPHLVKCASGGEAKILAVLYVEQSRTP